jgi:hypothetical protein
VIKECGMTLEEFDIVAKCNSAFTETYRPDEDVGQTEGEILRALHDFESYTEQRDFHYKVEEYENKNLAVKHDPDNPVCKGTNKIYIKKANLDFFKTAIYAATRRIGFYLVSNLSRKVLHQTGDGHFTSIAVFHKTSEYVLLLDSARFKYNSMWFKIEQVFESMKNKDQATARARGFSLCSKYY